MPLLLAKSVKQYIILLWKEGESLNLKILEKSIGYEFKNKYLLKNALTHMNTE